MAYVLSLQPHSPLKRSFSDNPCLQSSSSISGNLFRPLGDITTRNTSACSLYTLKSNRTADHFHGNENTPPLTSQSLLNLAPEKEAYPLALRLVNLTSHKRNKGVNRPHPFRSRTTAPSDPLSRKSRDSHITTKSTTDDEKTKDPRSVEDNALEDSDVFSLYEAVRVPLPQGRFSNKSDIDPYENHGPPTPSTAPLSFQPFRRWMSTLRKRHLQQQQDHDCSSAVLKSCDDMPLLSSLPLSSRRMSESMTSSMDYVTAMKSNSITVASTSIAPRSEAGYQSISRMRQTGSNFSDARRSLDSHSGHLGPVIDESAWIRSLQRRRIVEELISSEESYIADLKVLINDYFMILTAFPTLSSQTKTSIQQNISQILHLHEDLLAELHQVVPQADFTKSAHQESYPVTKAKHIRFHSADMFPGRFTEHKAARKLRHSLEIGRSPDRRPRGLVTDTETVGSIAKIFNRHMKRFFAYEEYGAHWTTMSQDLTTMCKGLHGWQEYERGVEALQKVITSQNNREIGHKKALSFSDLLIKPIQRVCKYPLLFDDLCRHTPVYDDPEAHAELEKALFRLQETIREVNQAKDDPQTRRLIEITWQLQDRLVFPEQAISRALVFRLLGHVLLCGVLHVTYQSPEPRIKGQYLICVLYKSCLILATSSRFQTPYSVVASIGLANSSIEESSNGRGIQCHTAPHTWKLIFEHGHRLHEIIFSACSAVEEEVWKKQLRERIVSETHDYVEGQSTMQDIFSSLTLDMKSLGPVFGHMDSLVRRMSVHRAATLGAKSSMSQVIIKNTQAQKMPDLPPTFSPGTVSRSQSHMSSNHVPTLAPRRAERIRLEAIVEDVWTKDSLPFPGMSNRKVENQIRASANSVMRKLSMVSIASNFSRRSPSFSSMSNTRSEDSSGSRVHRVPQRNLRARSATDRRPAPTVVDFHSAPAAFLPTDFEIQETRPSSRRRRLASRAAGNERPSDKNIHVKPKRVRKLSTHMMSLPRLEADSRVTARSISRDSSNTILRPPEALDDEKVNVKMEVPKKKGARDCGYGEDAGLAPPSKKFLKSKSRMFKFWI